MLSDLGTTQDWPRRPGRRFELFSLAAWEDTNQPQGVGDNLFGSTNLKECEAES